jgi:hypothetical protein
LPQNPATSDARVMVMGLDKGLKLVQQEPRGQGGHAVLFQFCPSVQQVRGALTFAHPLDRGLLMGSWLGAMFWTGWRLDIRCIAGVCH